MNTEVNPVKLWFKDYKEQFERYNKYIVENDWSSSQCNVVEYDMHKNIVNICLDRLKYFVKKFEPYIQYHYAKDIIEQIAAPINIHIDRITSYIKRNNWVGIEDGDFREKEMVFQTEIMSDYNKVKDKFIEINLEEKIEVNIPIHSDKPIPFLMREIVKDTFPQIEKLESIRDEMFDTPVLATVYDAVSSSKEMFINMKAKDIPPYDHTKHYYEHPKSTIDFYENEKIKFTQGITINGCYISPWLYWHLNFFKTDLPMLTFEGTDRYNPMDKTIITQPPLRDNELFFSDMYLRAARENVGLFIFGSRRVAKALSNEELLYYEDGSVGNIGNCSVGDVILDRDGLPTTIEGVYPQGVKKLWKFTLEDDRSVLCCADHLWEVHDGENYQVVNTQYLIDNFEENKFSIKLCKPIQYTNAVVPLLIDPYQLGVSIIQRKDIDFHITEEYYTHTIQSRLNIVRGVMDYGGMVSSTGEITFMHENTEKINQLRYLLHGLGIKNIMIDGVLHIYTKYPIFSNPNALKKMPRYNDVYSRHYLEHSYIKSIEYHSEKSATCIKVNNDSELFLTSDYIVTHNTTLEASILSWIATRIKNSESLVMGGEEADLQKLSRSLEIAFSFVHPAFRLPRNNNDWDSQIQFGLKDKAGIRIPYGDIFIRNLNKGRLSDSEKTAGATPDGWIVDEAGKFNVKAAYQAAIPSFQTPNGWGVVPILTGCITENNLIYTSDGTIISIKDLTLEDGIIGYNGDSIEVEGINWLKPPSYKKCFKIKTADGVFTECSYDHPFMVLEGKTVIIKKAQDITVGDCLMSIDNVPVFGKESYSLISDLQYYDDLILSELDKEHLIKYIENFINHTNSGNANSTYPRLNVPVEYESILPNIKLQLLKLGITTKVEGNSLVYSESTNNKYLFKYSGDEKGLYYKDKTLSSIFPVTVTEKLSVGIKKVYNLNTSTTHSYIVNGFITMNTGGNPTLSLEAQEMLLNPTANQILPMNWDLMEKFVGDPELITWQKKQFGIFIPGQMSYKTGVKKISVPLEAFYEKVSDNLIVPAKNISMSKLSGININITDWEQAKRVLDMDRASKEKELELLNKEKMYYPFDPLECFLNRGDNPFCAVEAQQHYDELMQSGDYGKIVDIGWSSIGNNLTTTFSNKHIADEFPFKGGVIDAPVLMFEDPPEHPKMDYTYVAGLDHYKQDTASTSSLGALYIFKRNVNIDDWSNRIVCSYVARPDRMEIFNETCEMLLMGYGATCLQENADVSFQQFLRAKGKDAMFLASGEEVARTNINPRASQNNKLGLTATKQNQDYLFKIAQNYVNEWIDVGVDELGNTIKKRGVTRINDPYLLKEIINYRPGLNVDRITAWSHSLALSRYYDSINLMPKINQRSDDSYEFKNSKKLHGGAYSNRRFSPY